MILIKFYKIKNLNMLIRQNYIVQVVNRVQFYQLKETAVNYVMQIVLVVNGQIQLIFITKILVKYLVLI